MRRLYNLILVSLPGKDFVSRLRKAVEQNLGAQAVAGAKPGAAEKTDDPVTGSGTGASDAAGRTGGIAGTWLEDKSICPREREEFTDWLRHSLADVSEAACAARTFEATMHAQMNALTDAFFSNHPGGGRQRPPASNERLTLGWERAQGIEISFLPLGGAGAFGRESQATTRAEPPMPPAAGLDSSGDQPPAPVVETPFPRVGGPVLTNPDSPINPLAEGTRQATASG
jgi:hypothetical protein